MVDVHGVTAPRAIQPKQTYLITRRCTQRQYLLRPDEQTTAFFAYCLVEASSRFGVRVIAWTCMSNHYHAVVEDPDGVLPAFLAHFHKMLAKVMNRKWGRHENFWAAGPPSVVRLVEAEDVVDKVVYTLANPTESDLVDAVTDWPGASSFNALDGRVLTARRPPIFFRRAGVMPEKLEFRAACPTNWPGGDADWATRVRAAVLARVGAARARRHELKRNITGRKAVLRTSHLARPDTVEARRELRPHLACKSAPRRDAELRALREFRSAYATARAQWAQGRRDVVFPHGTYKLRVDHAVTCAPVD